MACAAASGVAHWDAHAPLLATSYASHPVTHIEKHVIPGRTYTEVQPRVAVVEQPYVHQVGEQVHNVPTGVSYQSSSVVHSKKVVTPVLAQGIQKHVVPAEPIYKTYQEPAIVKTVATEQHVPVAYTAPVAYAAHAPSVYAHQTYAAPAVSYAAPAVSYAAHSPVYAKTLAAPLAYASHGAYAHGAYAHGSYAAAAPLAYSGYGHHAYSAPALSHYASHTPVVASPYSYGLGAKAALASPWSYGYGGVKSYAHQAW